MNGMEEQLQHNLATKQVHYIYIIYMSGCVKYQPTEIRLYKTGFLDSVYEGRNYLYFVPFQMEHCILDGTQPWTEEVASS